MCRYPYICKDDLITSSKVRSSVTALALPHRPCWANGLSFRKFSMPAARIRQFVPSFVLAIKSAPLLKPTPAPLLKSAPLPRPFTAPIFKPAPIQFPLSESAPVIKPAPIQFPISTSIVKPAPIRRPIATPPKPSFITRLLSVFG